MCSKHFFELDIIRDRILNFDSNATRRKQHQSEEKTEANSDNVHAFKGCLICANNDWINYKTLGPFTHGPQVVSKISQIVALLADRSRCLQTLEALVHRMEDRILSLCGKFSTQRRTFEYL